MSGQIGQPRSLCDTIRVTKDFEAAARQGMHRIQRPELQTSLDAIFSEEARVCSLLKVEAALATACARAGAIPIEAAEDIATHATLEHININQLREDTILTGYPVAPLVRQLTNACDEKYGQYCHWGATTQDIMDTALALQMCDAVKVIEWELGSLVDILIPLANKHRNTLMIGRTFGGHALPITFGAKVVRWMLPLCRHLERLRETLPRIAVGQLGGAVGTLASMGESAPEIRANFFSELKLNSPITTWHTARDSIAEIVCLLSIVCGSLGKIAQDIKTLSTTEIAEVFEPVTGGQDASSTLPQKQNPILSSRVINNAKIVACKVPLVLEAMLPANERDNRGFLEEKIVPEIFCLAGNSLATTNNILTGIRVDAIRMRRNFDVTDGQIMAEAYMMALAPHIGRLEAHDLIHQACVSAVQSGLSLKELLENRDEVVKHLGSATIEKLADPNYYLGDSDGEIDRAVDFARRLRNPSGSSLS